MTPPTHRWDEYDRRSERVRLELLAIRRWTFEEGMPLSHALGHVGQLEHVDRALTVLTEDAKRLHETEEVGSV
jgi:hypothetical protein